MANSNSDGSASWDHLYDFQKPYRSENQLTDTAFLRQLDLPGTLLPYQYSNTRQPSKKPSSLGGKLRQAIEDLQKNIPVNCEKNNLTDLLEEYFHFP
mmetsp:Transcript_16585/g.24956  ORF Transcript_16585/g.24956 Transcript_16585/m.24956 type:complete len:97 (-) Transcript_16585:824-1114(-)